MKPSNLLGLFFIFIPVFLLSDASGVLPDVARETNLFLVGTVAVVLASSQWVRSRNRILSSQPLLAPLFVLVLGLGLPMLSALYLWDALRGWILLLVGVVIYLAVTGSGMPAAEGERLLKIIAVCASAVVVYSLFRHFERPTPAQFKDFIDESYLTENMRQQMLFAFLLGRAKALFGNPNHLAAFTNLLVAAPLALFLQGRKIGWRIFCAACVVAHLWLLYLTVSRAGMLSFAGACAVTVFLWWWMRGARILPYQRRLALLVMGVVLVAGLILVLAASGHLRPLLQTRTLQTRLCWWAAAVKLIPSAPWWGEGLRMFALRFPNVRDIGSPESQFIHNYYLETALAGGPLALLALFWIQLAACRAVWRIGKTRRQGEEALLLAAAFGISVFWIHAAFDFIQEQAEICLLSFFYLGLLGCMAVARSPRPAGVRRKPLLAAGVVFLLSVWVLLLFVPWQGMMSLAHGKAALEEKPPRLGPSNNQMRRATRWIPLASEPHYFLACNQFYGGGDPRTAIDHMRRAIRRNPAMPHYHSTLGDMLWAVGLRQEALAEISVAIGLHPAKPEYYFQRSRFRAAEGDEDGAAADRLKGEQRQRAEEVWRPRLEKLLSRP